MANPVRRYTGIRASGSHDYPSPARPRQSPSPSLILLRASCMEPPSVWASLLPPTRGRRFPVVPSRPWPVSMARERPSALICHARMEGRRRMRLQATAAAVPIAGDKWRRTHAPLLASLLARDAPTAFERRAGGGTACGGAPGGGDSVRRRSRWRRRQGEGRAVRVPNPNRQPFIGDRGAGALLGRPTGSPPPWLGWDAGLADWLGRAWPVSGPPAWPAVGLFFFFLFLFLFQQ